MEMDHALEPRRRSRSRLTAAAAALLAALALASTSLAHISSESGAVREAAGIRSSLAEMSELTRRGLAPPAARLVRSLPAETGRLNDLRGPAVTVEGQLGVALGELQQMSASAADPHYFPALIAVGRAAAAATGRDPLTGTTINPEYLGLDRELAAGAGRLEAADGDAAALANGLKRLKRQLKRSQRRARALAREIERTAAREAGR